MIQLFPVMWRTSSLNRSEWGACIVAGSTVLPIAFLLKRTGKKILNNIPGTKFVDEDNDQADALVDQINKQMNTQVNVNTDMFKRNKGSSMSVSGKEEEYTELDNEKNV